MSQRMQCPLWNAQQGHQAFRQAWEAAKPLLMAGHRLMLELRPATRSLEQNARLHAMLRDVARQVQWAGKPRDVDTWKRLMVAAWLRARGQAPELLPAIDGHGVDILVCHTSALGVDECGELMEFIAAWGAQHGVRFADEERGGINNA